MNKNEITLSAHAKINLSLRVLRRREDGYHDISSLMQGIELHDVITVTKCPENGTKYNLPHCTIGQFDVYLCADAKTIPTDMNNLALKGIAAVAAALNTRRPELELPRELLVCIDKRLPVSAGLAGGSGDAAACMLGLNALMGNVFSLRELMRMGSSVGADVPFSLMMNTAFNAGTLAGCSRGLAGAEEASTAAVVSGIGDLVEPTSPMSRHLLIVNPGVSVSTREAYEALDDLLEKAEEPYAEQLFVNDFEKYTLTACREAGELSETMHRLLRAENIMMSGSGPTIVAYYRDELTAAEDLQIIERLYPERPAWRAWLSETGRTA